MKKTIVSQLKRKSILIVSLFFCFCVGQLQIINNVLADQLPESELQALNEYPNWVGTSTSSQCGGFSSSPGTNGPVATSQVETDNAKTIIGIAKTENLGEQAALVGLITSIDESTLTNLANENVPLSEQNPNKQGDGSNGTSLGIFQQQITDGWSTISSDISDTNAINQLMTPAYAAEAFFGSPYGSNAPSALTKGLQDVAGWQNMEPWVAAEKVQHSATLDGSNYERYIPQAQSLLNQYWNSAQAVSLPVALSGGSTGGGNNGPGTTGSGCRVSCTPSGSTTTSGLSQTRQNIVCITEQELQLWKSGQLKPGTNAYFKYSDNRAEQWCADFASWVYNQAGDPLGPNGSDGASWDVINAGNFNVPPQDSSKFTFHSIGSGYTPQPGDVAVHGDQHVNIVVAVSGSTITLIGGDQGDNSYPTNIVSEYSTSDPSSDIPPITGYLSPN